MKKKKYLKVLRIEELEEFCSDQSELNTALCHDLSKLRAIVADWESAQSAIVRRIEALSGGKINLVDPDIERLMKREAILIALLDAKQVTMAIKHFATHKLGEI